MIKSIKKISRHFFGANVINEKSHKREHKEQSLKADIALALELTLTCVHREKEGGRALLAGTRSLDTQLWAQPGLWKLVPPQERQVNTTPHSLRLVTAQRAGPGRMGAAPTQPKWENEAPETKRGEGGLGLKQELELRKRPELTHDWSATCQFHFSFDSFKKKSYL